MEEQETGSKITEKNGFDMDFGLGNDLGCGLTFDMNAYNMSLDF